MPQALGIEKPSLLEVKGYEKETTANLLSEDEEHGEMEGQIAYWCHIWATGALRLAYSRGEGIGQGHW